jgi:hypothetical protein
MAIAENHIFIVLDTRDLKYGWFRPSLVLFMYIYFLASLPLYRIWQTFNSVG